MGNWEGKRQSGLQLKLPKVSLGQVKDVELVFDRRWYVCLSYENGLQIEEQKQGVTTSIDPEKFTVLLVLMKMVIVWWL